MNSFRIFAFIVLSMVLNISALFGQTYTLYGDKCFGGNRYENYLRIIKYNENLILVGSSKSSPLTGNHSDSSCNYTAIPADGDIWMVKFDSSFNILSDKSLGGDKEEHDVKSVILSNNQLIFSCISNSNLSCDKSENNVAFPGANNDFWICSIDSNGNKNWDKTFGGLGSEWSPQIIKLTDGNYITAGLSASGVGGDKTVPSFGGTDFWVIKFDSVGNKIWDNDYGGSGQESDNNATNGIGSRLIPTESSSFILMCGTYSPVSGNISQPSQGVLDLWIVKIDSVGYKIWDKRYGGDFGDYASDIISTPDKGFMVLASTNSNLSGDVSQPNIGSNTDVWVLKLDSVAIKFGIKDMEEQILTTLIQ